MLNDVDVRTRESVVTILRTVGDQDSIPKLEQLMREETVPGIKASCKKAIEGIREREGEPELTPIEWEGRLKNLEERLEALEKTKGELSDRH